MSPALAAGISDWLWSMEDIVALIDAREDAPKKRGSKTNRHIMKYTDIGRILGFLVAIPTFFGAWGYCTIEYGFLFGFGLGWLPAFILAIIFWAVMIPMWAFVILTILYLWTTK